MTRATKQPRHDDYYDGALCMVSHILRLPLTRNVPATRFSCAEKVAFQPVCVLLIHSNLVDRAYDDNTRLLGRPSNATIDHRISHPIL